MGEVWLKVDRSDPFCVIRALLAVSDQRISWEARASV
jgi:hypothetical protein